MYTSVELLDMVKARFRLPSDYAAAKKIGVTKSSISKIRAKGTSFGIDQCIVIAELLEIDPMKIIGSARIEQLERQHDTKYLDMWKHYAA